LKQGEVLQVVNEAYFMYHRIPSEWPSLSLDFINNPNLDNKQGIDIEYPLDVFIISAS
jgi:hypothetical protein